MRLSICHKDVEQTKQEESRVYKHVEQLNNQTRVPVVSWRGGEEQTPSWREAAGARREPHGAPCIRICAMATSLAHTKTGYLQHLPGPEGDAARAIETGINPAPTMLNAHDRGRQPHCACAERQRKQHAMQGCVGMMGVVGLWACAPPRSRARSSEICCVPPTNLRSWN